MHPAIKVENLGKSYRLGEGSQRAHSYRTLRESLVDVPAAILRRMRNGLGGDRRVAFWALKDLDFEVAPGEVVGIIGRNGAGKSTLLKILSRITKPTTGHAELHGRVGSLLEVGTGFHPELTGRENVYLNGAILGMSRREIARKFDEIVAFAGVEEFLDTPVKRYSSGMYVRLAFAVAAHLELEIMVVDEVLAVGDMEFQRRCLGKMNEVAHSGRTVLFVSHNMAAVRSLCTRGIVLDRGQRVFDGDVQRAIEQYLACQGAVRAHWPLEDIRRGRSGTQRARFTELAFEDDDGQPVTSIPMGDSLNIVLRFRCDERLAGMGLGFGIRVNDTLGTRLFRFSTGECLRESLPGCQSGGEVRCRIPRVPLVAGTYLVSLAIGLSGGETLDHLNDVASFEVVDADVFGTGKAPKRDGGLFVVESQWSFDYT
jgi:lipopolysaccharide transport system ATP-binding protein